MSTLTFVYTGKCTHCGHKSCIVNEEESCNWDGCYECNAAEFDRDLAACKEGRHDVFWQGRCVVCQITEDELDAQRYEERLAEHKADNSCEQGWHFSESTWDPKTCTAGTRCAACGATSDDFGDTWKS